MSIATAPYSKSRAWLTCIVGIFSAIVLSFMYAAVSCSMDLFMEQFDIGSGAAGWLVTGCYLVSVVLALPGGVLVDKYGPLKVGLVGMVFAIVGTILGAFANDFAFLMFTRIIQGVGPALVAITVPTIISAWFASAKRGPAMTLFSLWQTIGIFIVFMAASFLLVPEDVTSWHNLWWFSLVFEIIATILYAAFIRMPDVRQDLDEIEEPKKDAKKDTDKGSSLKAFTSVATWMLAVTFACWAIQVDTLINFSSLYCIDVLGMESATANSDVSMISAGMVVGGLIMTPILGKVKTMNARLIFLLVGEIVISVLAFFMFRYGQDQALPYMITTGIIIMIVPAISFTIAPDTALKPEYLGATLGIFALAQNLGLGAAIAGTFLEMFGWDNMCMMSLFVSVILIASSLIVFITMKRRHAA